MRTTALLTSLTLVAWASYGGAAEETRDASAKSETPSAELSERARSEPAPALKLEPRDSLSSVELASGDYRVRLGAVIQADGRFFVDEGRKTGIDSFFLRRAQMTIRGKVGQYLDFYISPDFGLGKARLAEVTVDFLVANAVNLRVGRAKVPVSQEWLQSGRMILLLERSLPSSLTPQRDEGVLAHGAPWRGRLAYAIGIFNGAADGESLDVDADDGKQVVARVLAQPWASSTKNPLSGLALGLAYTTEDRNGAPPAYKSAGQLTFFSYVKDALADGRQVRIAPQGSFYRGPFGVQAELVRSSSDVALDGLRTRVTHQAWSAIASIVLAGGTAEMNSVKITRPLGSGANGWGAVQLAARIEGFDADSDAFAAGLADSSISARRARGVGVGLHWYPSQSVRWSVVFNRTQFEGGSPTGDRAVESAVQFRAQVVF